MAAILGPCPGAGLPAQARSKPRGRKKAGERQPGTRHRWWRRDDTGFREGTPPGARTWAAISRLRRRSLRRRQLSASPDATPILRRKSVATVRHMRSRTLSNHLVVSGVHSPHVSTACRRTRDGSSQGSDTCRIKLGQSAFFRTGPCSWKQFSGRSSAASWLGVPTACKAT